MSDKSYVLDIYPARERAEDFPGITSEKIIDLLDNGESIDDKHANELYQYKGNVILFMSPKEIAYIKNDLICHLQNELK